MNGDQAPFHRFECSRFTITKFRPLLSTFDQFLFVWPLNTFSRMISSRHWFALSPVFRNRNSLWNCLVYIKDVIATRRRLWSMNAHRIEDEINWMLSRCGSMLVLIWSNRFDGLQRWQIDFCSLIRCSFVIWRALRLRLSGLGFWARNVLGRFSEIPEPFNKAFPLFLRTESIRETGKRPGRWWRDLQIFRYSSARWQVWWVSDHFHRVGII